MGGEMPKTQHPNLADGASDSKEDWRTPIVTATTLASFEQIAEEWPALYKKTADLKVRARARYLLLQCYRPFVEELAALNAMACNAPYVEVVDACFTLSSRWHVDPSKGADFNISAWRLPAATLASSWDKDPHKWSQYGDSAREYLRSLGVSSDQVDEGSDLEALRKVGYANLLVDLTRPIGDIKAAIMAVKVSEGIDTTRPSKKQKIRSEATLIRSAVHRIGTPTLNDPTIIKLHSEGRTPAQITRALDGDYNSATSNRSRETRRLKTLLAFVDPLDYGKYMDAMTARKRRV
jgi:hypothetical protein